MPPKQKKKGAQLERMLLETIPETPVPQPYFNIPSPAPYRFPLSQTLLEGVKLLQHYEPNETNEKIRTKLPNSRIQRMIRFRDTFCMMGKGGNGLLIDDKFLNIRGASAFAYGPTHLIIAYEDLRLQVYALNLKLIKTLKGFSQEKITFLKILQTPKNFESIVILAHSGKRLHLYRIQKSLFSTLSCKLSKVVISHLEYPVTQIMEIPALFRFYLRKDKDYRDCSLVCVSAVNKIFILKINHFRIGLDDFVTIDHVKNFHSITTNSVSWGEAFIQAPSRFINGDKLVLTYSFGDEVYFLALRQIDKYIGGQVVAKCEWVESCPLTVNEGKVAFCQYMKKNQIMIITEENEVIIFHTKKFDIFEKQINTKNMEVISQKYGGNLQARKIWTVAGKREPETRMQNPSIDLTEQERNLINEVPLVTYADTFQYEYSSNEIFFLTEKKFGIFLYCDWKIIANIMKVQQKYESAMLFLIAIYKKANKFDLGVQGSQAQLSEFIQMLAIQYINNKLSKIKNMPQIIESILQNPEYFKMLVTPIQFLTQTNQFTFLFDIAKDKIISSLMVSDKQNSYHDAEKLFYDALIKFIEHGRIKFIPEQQLMNTLKYFSETQNLGMLDRLAIYFDLSRIDRNIVIQCLLSNNLVVSLAHICTQGNESEFVTPFVKFWGISQNYRLQKKDQYAAMFAIRALWYVQLCLQRNWALKEYSFEKYASMIRVLSQHFLTQKIITGLLSIKPQYCLETLTFYFTIENAQIISEQSMIKLKLSNANNTDWIVKRQGFEQIQNLLISINSYLVIALKNRSQSDKLFNLFLSSIIIYKTVKFSSQKYLDILISLIQNDQFIEKMNFGLQEKLIVSFKEKYDEHQEVYINKILSARYINKILTLVFYECHDFIKPRLPLLLEKATMNQLTDLQAQISFLQGNYRKCIQTYTRAKSPANSLVFEFLQNSFKRLILEKKKNQKRQLAGCITEQIKWMVNLDPHETKKIVQIFIPQIQEQLIFALRDDESLQLDFLEGIVNDENLKQMKNNLSEESINRFVQLMAIHKKEKLLQVFKNNQRFVTEDTLRICQEHHVYDCMELLYERMGNIIASVTIASLRIDELLQKRADQGDEYEQAPYIKIKQILDNSIEVCRKNHSEEIWESLLDSFIALYNKYKESNFPQSQLQIFFYINGEVMENLASNCPIEHTIDLLQNKYQNLNMGGKMTKAFINILSNLSHSINILYIATNLIQVSLHHIQQQDHEKKLQCYSTGSVCESCGFGIIKTKKSTHFKCGHSYHVQCIVSRQAINVPICISCLKKQTDQFDYYLNTLNPQHPRIKKIKQLFDKFDEKKLEMSQTFRIEEFQTIDNRQKKNDIKQAKDQKKKAKFKNFDQSVYEIQSGDRRVLRELHI